MKGFVCSDKLKDCYQLMLQFRSHLWSFELIVLVLRPVTLLFWFSLTVASSKKSLMNPQLAACLALSDTQKKLATFQESIESHVTHYGQFSIGLS